MAASSEIVTRGLFANAFRIPESVFSELFSEAFTELFWFFSGQFLGSFLGRMQGVFHVLTLTAMLLVEGHHVSLKGD
jgi:hypothetical protein